MMRALSASCAPGTTRNRLFLTALSMICRKLIAIERLRDRVGGSIRRTNSSAVCRAKPVIALDPVMLAVLSTSRTGQIPRVHTMLMITLQCDREVQHDAHSVKPAHDARGGDCAGYSGCRIG